MGVGRPCVQLSWVILHSRNDSLCLPYRRLNVVCPQSVAIFSAVTAATLNLLELLIAMPYWLHIFLCVLIGALCYDTEGVRVCSFTTSGPKQLLMLLSS